MKPSRALLLVLLLAATHGAAFLAGTGSIGQDFLAEENRVPGTRSATANVVAVTTHGGGNLGTVEATVQPGTGRVLLDTDPFVGTDTQDSAQTAARVAARLTSTSLRNTDVVYSFDISGRTIGGPSAGAAMTVATVAAIRNDTVRSDGVVTGAVRSDGRVGRVGSVLEKAVAAGRGEMSLLLVPPDQTRVTYYRRDTGEVVDPSLVVRGEAVEPVRVDLNRETTRRFGMETRGVRTASAAVNLLVTQR